MNTIKFYRPRADGDVEVSLVRCTQARGARRKGNKFIGYMRHVEDYMLKRGWTRRRLKPGAIRSTGIASAVRRALAA